MGECEPSSIYVYESPGVGEVALEFWDAGYPEHGDEPIMNVCAVAGLRHCVVGLELEQVRALHRVLGRWIDAQSRGRG